MDIQIVIWLAAFALFYVFAFGLFSSAVHMVRSGIRLYRGDPSKLNWLIAGRWLVVLVAFLWIAALLAVVALSDLLKWGSVLENEIAATLALIGLWAMIMLPVFLPLAEVAYRHQTSSMTLAVASVIAFPVLVAFSMSMIYQYVVTDMKAMHRLETGTSIVELSAEVPAKLPRATLGPRCQHRHSGEA